MATQVYWLIFQRTPLNKIVVNVSIDVTNDVLPSKHSKLSIGQVYTV